VNLQEAIAVALEFEKEVRDHYLRGAEAIASPRGRRVFATLGKEEQRHVDYLEHCLALWKRTGKVPDVPLTSVLPKDAGWIAAEQKKLSEREGQGAAAKSDLDALETALRYERETDAFYRRLVSDLPKGDRPLFDKFLGVEEGHLALVEAQLDALRGKGFWFDVSAFIQDG